jgi:hypothetical protein
MLLRFAFAASLLVLFVPYVSERTPEVPVVKPRTARVIAEHGALASSPAVVAASRAATRAGGDGEAG